MEIWEINLTGKGICLYFPRWIQQTFSSENSTHGGPGIQNGDETTRTPGGRNSNIGHGGFQPYDLSSWGQIKTLTNQAENLVSQQGLPQSPENLPARAGLTD